MEHRKYGVVEALEGGDTTLHHIRLRGQVTTVIKWDFMGQRNTMEQNMLMLVDINLMLDVFKVYISTGSVGHAWSCAFA